ncbi:MAG: dihydrolipoyl dehydrogenase [Bdellovibrionaceae bacterium]|nr:dihydrolipoyl dehydrogenase [Pseudobdellovibrionaceae bacterium]
MFDLVVIGAGPGGYTSAIRASQLGLKVAIIEKRKTLGGTCLNIGCIPSKALLDSSEHYIQAQEEFEDHGLTVSGIKINLDRMMGRKDKVVSDLTSGVAYLMKKNKVETFYGFGKIKNANTVEVRLDSGETTSLETKNILLATGSAANTLPGIEIDEQNIVSSTGALSLPVIPEHLVVIGAGVIGLELGSVWKRLGSKVTVIEYGSKIAASSDTATSKLLQRSLTKQGMEFVLEAKVNSAQVNKNNKVEVEYEGVKTGEKQKLVVDTVLVATGRRPYSEGLGLEDLGIEKNKAGFVMVNSHYQTTVPNIYAIGDLIPGPMLAHKAEEEGVAVAETLAGLPGHVNYMTVPSVIYTWPELASVGYTEEELKDKKIAYNAGKFPFTANGRAKSLGCTDGQVKILADKETDQILGVHILGPRASDMIAEAVVAMEFGASAEDIARSFHAHPTLSEVMREAALDVNKAARQF